MKITTILQAGLPGADETSVSVLGDIITIDGEAIDLGGIEEGGKALIQPDPGEDPPILGEITRRNGELCLTIRYQFDPLTAEPHQEVSPAVVSVSSGSLPDPVKRRQNKGER